MGANDPAGSVNGVSGYDISAVFVAYGFFTPTFTLNVSPLPSGFPPPSSTHPAEFSLIGPDVLTLVSDKPNPAPCSTTAFCPNDLLTFDFAPAVYSFVGFGPASVYGNFSLDITQETPTGLTPEPGSWVLLLTGLAGLALRHSARLPTPRRRTRAAAA